jgi:hypothetical protein
LKYDNPVSGFIISGAPDIKGLADMQALFVAEFPCFRRSSVLAQRLSDFAFNCRYGGDRMSLYSERATADGQSAVGRRSARQKR